MQSPAPDLSPTEALLLETLRGVEARGPLDDALALRQAARAPAGHVRQVVARARVLDERLGIEALIQTAHASLPLWLLGLALLTLLVGFFGAGTLLGSQDRRINVLAALGLLVPHLLTLLLWLAALLRPAQAGGALAGLSMLAGRVGVQISARLALGRGLEMDALQRAARGLLARTGLQLWGLGLLSHLFWCLCFVGILAALLFGLAFRQYTLGWETTLLEPQTQGHWAELLGRAPAALGFPVSVAADEPDLNRGLAWWLVGCVSVYGLLPRLLAACVCLVVWRLRRARWVPDFDAAYYRTLFTRLDAAAPVQIVDADSAPPSGSPSAPTPIIPGDGAMAVIGFELPDEVIWPPIDGAEAAVLLRRIDGSLAAIDDLLSALSGLGVRRFELCCHAGASPDRSVERFIRALHSLGAQGRLRLLSIPGDASEMGALRWHRWLDTLGLAALLPVESVSKGESPS